VVSLAPAARSGVLRAAVGGGVVALGAGLLGYTGVALGLIPEINGHLPFAFRSLHPLFPNVLRLAGTFGESCQAWAGTRSCGYRCCWSRPATRWVFCSAARPCC
jgi:hypothetical protein